MTDFAVPFDNNGSERDLKNVEIAAENSGLFPHN
jgi:hypothetical protein